MFTRIKTMFGLDNDMPCISVMKFEESPYLAKKREESISHLGDRYILKGGKYKPENGNNPTYVGQKL